MKRYLNTISAFQFFQLARYATLVVTGIVFTKTALTQEAIGEYETFVFIAGAVSFFWLNGLLKALLPLSSERDSSKRALFSAFVLISGFSVLAVLLLLLLRPFFSEFLLNSKPIPAFSLLLVYLVLGIPANLAEYVYLVKKNNRALVIYAVAAFSVQFILVVLPVILGHSIIAALKGLVLSALLRYLWLWGLFIYYREIRFSAAFMKRHLKLGLPLVAATFLSGSAQFVDGFIVTSRFDAETFAVFRYGARELPLAMLLANALSSALLPEFSRKERLAETLALLKKNVRRLMHLLFPLTAVLLLISHPLFPVLFNPRFEASATIFNIYLLLIISRLMMPQTILNGRGEAREIMTASFLELVLNVTLSLLFVRWWGIAGIAFATFVAYLFEKIFLALLLWKKMKIRLTDYLPWRDFLLYSAGIVIIFIFAEIFF